MRILKVHKSYKPTLRYTMNFHVCWMTLISPYFEIKSENKLLRVKSGESANQKLSLYMEGQTPKNISLENCIDEKMLKSPFITHTKLWHNHYEEASRGSFLGYFDSNNESFICLHIKFQPLIYVPQFNYSNRVVIIWWRSELKSGRMFTHNLIDFQSGTAWRERIWKNRIWNAHSFFFTRFII